MLGAFNAQYDYDGRDVSDIITEPEAGWSGTVYVSNFEVTDHGYYDSETDLSETSQNEPTTPESTIEQSPTQESETEKVLNITLDGEKITADTNAKIVSLRKKQEHMLLI